MNSHQRRKESRRRHMLLPLGKEIDIRCLLGRWVLTYPGQKKEFVCPHRHKDLTATVQRHIFPHGVDIAFITPKGDEIHAKTSISGLKLKKKTDREPRPWWAKMRRRQRGA